MVVQELVADDISLAEASEEDLERVRQYERFKWFARGLTDLNERYDVPALLDLVEGRPARPGQREKAIVMLALRGTDDARAALHGIDTDDESVEFVTFVEVAQAVAEQGDEPQF